MNARHILSAIAFAGSAFLASCDKDTKVFGATDLSSERSTVAGRVTGVGDTGVSGIVVTAQAVAADGAILPDVPAQTALSGESGRFSLALQPGRKWKISWQSPDYRTDEGQGTLVDLGLHQTVELPEAKRLTYRYGWIAGRTAPHAAVAIEGQDVSTLADDQGRFQIARVVPGTVSVVGIVPGKGSWRVTELVQAEKVDTVRGVEQIASWRPLAKLTGILVNQDGTPQQGAKLSTLGGLVTATTDVQGRFLLENLPAKGRVVVQVSRGLGTKERLVLPTPGEDSTADLGELPLSGSFSGSGIYIGNGLVLADSGDVVTIPLLWELLDSSRSVLGFAWDTSGTGVTSRALRTWGPRTPELKVGSRSRTISAWVVVAIPRANGGFDTAWSSEARLSILVRSKAAAPDSLEPVEFSHDPTQPWFGPLRVGISSPSAGATLLWSTDSSSNDWFLWNPDDSIVLFDTTTIWAFARQRGKLDSRMVRTTFNVRPSSIPETLQTNLSSSVTLPQGSLFQAYGCLQLADGVSLVLDSGATLKLAANCNLSINNENSLELRAGSKLILGSKGRITVGYDTPGQLLVKGRPGRYASILPGNPSNLPAVAGTHVLTLFDNADGSRIEGLDLDGSAGGGILVEDAEVDIVASRIRNCKESGITFEGTGRPLTPDAMSDNIIEGNRWGISSTPYALGNIPTIKGLGDTILVPYSTQKVIGNTLWSRQNRPLVIETLLEINDQAQLVLDSGIAMLFTKGTGLRVGSSTEGSLDIRGTASAPVTLRGRTPAGWGLETGGITISPNAGLVRVRHLHLAGSVSNGISCEVPVAFENVRSDSNTLAGIRFDGAGIATSFQSVSTRNNRRSVSSTPFALGSIPHSPGLLDTLEIHAGGQIEGAARWAGQPRPAIATTGIEVNGSSSLHLDSGLVLLFDKGTYLRVGSVSPGSLTAEGTATALVVLRARTSAGWGDGYGGLSLKASAHDIVLRFVSVSGSSWNGIYAEVPVDIQNVRSDSNALSGIEFDGEGSPVPETFSGIGTRGNRWAISTTPFAMASIPTLKGLQDTVRVLGSSAVEGAASWAPQNVPVVVTSLLDITNGASLTLQAGLQLRFDVGAYLRVGSSTPASLQIAGTATNPVRMAGHGSFWGYTPASPDGYGILLGYYATAASIQNLILDDLPANGISVQTQQPGVVDISNVTMTTWTPAVARTVLAILLGDIPPQNINENTIVLNLKM